MLRSRVFWIGPVIGMVLVCLPSQSADAWSERGHTVVTRVAVHLLAERAGNNPALTRPFLFRQDMLAHLSNIPDTGWRHAAASVVRANQPTHHTWLDHLVSNPGTSVVPTGIEEAVRAARRRGHDLAKETGTGLWRIDQLWQLLVGSLTKIVGRSPLSPLSKTEFDSGVLEALTYAGLLSHFVADMANPDHTASGPDGWNEGQGGIHRFFETTVVNVLPLDLEQAVMDHVSQHRPFVAMIEQLPASKREAARRSPLMLAALLAKGAFRRLDEMKKLDKEHALLVPSNAKQRTPAKRKAAHEVAATFQPFIVERLAAGADILAHLWRLAWQQSGGPNLSAFDSWEYAMTPAFVQPSYLAEVAAETAQ